MSLLGFPVDGSAPSDAHNWDPSSPGAQVTTGTGTGEDLADLEDPDPEVAETIEGTGNSRGSTAGDGVSSDGSDGISKTVKYGAAAAALAGIAYKSQQ